MRINTNSTKAIRLKKPQLPKPPWMKIRPPTTDEFLNIKNLLKQKKLTTVCSEAHCPNVAECWSSGTATFMVLGDTCTRACRFCMVKSGHPKGKIDKDEPKKLVEAVKIMDLEYVVLTCVTRDDLPDGGAQHFADCVKALKKAFPKLLIELLISDLGGNLDSLKTITESGATVVGHNLETVERLQSEVRDPRASYKQSLKILQNAKQQNPDIYTKTSLMVGLGETEEEIIQTMKDSRKIGVDVITFGQYLRPSPFHLEVKEYIKPAQFEHYKKLAKKHGFIYSASGPFVRSSYKAGEHFLKNLKSP